MRHLLAALPLIALTACVPQPDTGRTNVLGAGVSPAYLTTSTGAVLPASCYRDLQTGFGGLPPGCTRDTVFAAQVADPRDLVVPVIPGNASIATSVGATQQVVIQGVAPVGPEQQQE